jgi:hypothetical protein
MTTKACLANNTRAKNTADELPFVPKTFVIPEDCDTIHQSVSSAEASGIWIVKPSRSGGGNGIRVVRGLEEALGDKKNVHSCVVQSYIEPLLFKGYKFDFRIYVFVASFYPVEAYYHEQGYARFCVNKYSTSSLEDPHTHVTNVVTHKHKKAGGQTYSPLQVIWRELSSQGVDVLSIQAAMKSAVQKVLLCTETAIGRERHAVEQHAAGAVEQHRAGAVEQHRAGAVEQHKAGAVEQHKAGAVQAVAEAAVEGVAEGGEAEVQAESEAIEPPKHADQRYFQLIGFDVLLDHQHHPLVLEANGNSVHVFDLALHRQIIFDMLEKVFCPRAVPIRGVQIQRAGSKRLQNTNATSDALLTMQALADDWLSGGDKLLHADEWCLQHWRWRQDACRREDASVDKDVDTDVDTDVDKDVEEAVDKEFDCPEFACSGATAATTAPAATSAAAPLPPQATGFPSGCGFRPLLP